MAAAVFRDAGHGQADVLSKILPKPMTENRPRLPAGLECVCVSVSREAVPAGRPLWVEAVENAFAEDGGLARIQRAVCVAG
jgi:hypothetical protein